MRAFSVLLLLAIEFIIRKSTQKTSVHTENAAKTVLRIYKGGVMNKQYTAVIDTTSCIGNALNYLGGPDDNQMKNQD